MKIFTLAVVTLGLMGIGIVNLDEKNAVVGRRTAPALPEATRSSPRPEQLIATQKLMRDPWEKPDSEMAKLTNR